MAEIRVVSPCISVCEFDEDTALCKGCYRTQREVGVWRFADADQQAQILKDLAARWRAVASPAPDDAETRERQQQFAERLRAAGLIDQDSCEGVGPVAVID